ncbi:PHB depolymerase family esterase [Maribius pontilimi]|uniref:PHB depolymerase family esterase n=1 Tax=Palleronia pontilimi TaxID=1964209 RepID=A0A934MHU7_9RHOB|nr:PHB depolymerase family esterase [Palleronia pontilimi]MBJ3763639.1 PHB depolymerase family esterase [Palleronia pontilimi]
MNEEFSQAMRQALEATRAGDPGAATAIIQSALGGQPLPAQAPPLKAPPVHTDARIQSRRHACSGGARSYRLFVPTRPARGVVLMLHGCTQTPEDFARGVGMDALAEDAGFVVAYPAQTAAQNAQSCWNWFLPAHQSRTGGEAEMLANLARDLATEFDVGDRIFVAGLSAGGAMAAVLADTHPELFAAIGVHSGLPAGAAQDVNAAFAAMRAGGTGRAPRVPAIVFHGTSDTTVSPRNARMLVPGDGIETSESGNGRSWTRLTSDTSELWLVKGAGHAWFGGGAGGSYADPKGPGASAEMLRFFDAQGTRT